MEIGELQQHWDALARRDPLWAILTFPDKRGNRWRVDEFFQAGEREIEAVLAHVEGLGFELPRHRALDFGCGVGRLTQALARRFEQVVGVDISPTMIELAGRYNRHPDRCRYYLNQVDDLATFANSSFDFVYSSLTLQHMAPRHARNYLREFLRLLTPAGLIVFELPSERTRTWRQRLKPFLPRAFLSAYQRRVHSAFPRMEMHGMAREEVVQFLEGGGGRIVDIQPHPGLGWQGFRYFVGFGLEQVTVAHHQVG